MYVRVYCNNSINSRMKSPATCQGHPLHPRPHSEIAWGTLVHMLGVPVWSVRYCPQSVASAGIEWRLGSRESQRTWLSVWTWPDVSDTWAAGAVVTWSDTLSTTSPPPHSPIAKIVKVIITNINMRRYSVHITATSGQYVVFIFSFPQ